MGIFHEQVEIVNRTSATLEIVYDGQRIKIQPNYTPEGKLIATVHTMVPRQVIPFALNQTVLMGSEDAIDPGYFTSLIGIVDPKERRPKSWHNIEYLEQSDAITRTPLEDVLDDPNAKIQVKGRKIPRNADHSVPGITPFDLAGRV